MSMAFKRLLNFAEERTRYWLALDVAIGVQRLHRENKVFDPLIYTIIGKDNKDNYRAIGYRNYEALLDVFRGKHKPWSVEINEKIAEFKRKYRVCSAAWPGHSDDFSLPSSYAR